jgi:chromate transporter
MTDQQPAPRAESPVLAPSVSFFQAFCFWLKLGFISFGGPAGQISIMHQELVERRRWISEKRSNWPSILAGCCTAAGAE